MSYRPIAHELPTYSAGDERRRRRREEVEDEEGEVKDRRADSECCQRRRAFYPPHVERVHDSKQRVYGEGAQRCDHGSSVRSLKPQASSLKRHCPLPAILALTRPYRHPPTEPKGHKSEGTRGFRGISPETS